MTQPAPLHRVPVRPAIRDQNAPPAMQIEPRRTRSAETRSDSLAVRPTVRGQNPLSSVQVAPRPIHRVGATETPLGLTRATEEELRSKQTRIGGGRAMLSVFASLAIVLGVFFCFAWITRRHAPAGMALLPSEVVEQLGRAPLGARQQMQLIRLGNRLLLLSVTPQGAETLAEVSEPDEVDRLAGLCQRNRTGSVSDSFRQVFSQITSEPTSPGFLGEVDATASRTSRAG